MPFVEYVETVLSSATATKCAFTISGGLPVLGGGHGQGLHVVPLVEYAAASSLTSTTTFRFPYAVEAYVDGDVPS